jgi:Ca2+-binding EF-hand superfamily protein
MSEAHFSSLITENMLEMPSYCNRLLMKRVSEMFPSPVILSLASEDELYVSCQSFLSYYEREVAAFEKTERLFRLLKKIDNSCLMPTDLIPLIKEVLNSQVDLQTMRGLQEAEHYIATVITRFFYSVNTSRTGQISLREFRLNSRLDAALNILDDGVSVNEEMRYFNLKHFVVLYNSFVELDRDHDGLLHIKDIQGYQHYALTPVLVNR